MGILLAIAILLLLWRLREGYVDPDRKITRPSLSDATWKSKVDAEAPIGGDDSKYIEVLQRFYDNVYVPAEMKPTDKKVEEFLNSADAQVTGVEKEPLRRIIISSFSIERTTTATAREEKEIVKTGALAGFKGANLQPEKAVDPLAREESSYTPVDARTGDLPEGVYAPVEQQAQPRNPGDWDSRSTSWTDVQFASVRKI